MNSAIVNAEWKSEVSACAGREVRPRVEAIGFVLAQFQELRQSLESGLFFVTCDFRVMEFTTPNTALVHSKKK
jgi:hypothetical protein